MALLQYSRFARASAGFFTSFLFYFILFLFPWNHYPCVPSPCLPVYSSIWSLTRDTNKVAASVWTLFQNRYYFSTHPGRKKQIGIKTWSWNEKLKFVDGSLQSFIFCPTDLSGNC